MRIGMAIGALGRGGAENQLCELALGLSGRGHNVEVCEYAGQGIMRERLLSCGIPVRSGEPGSRLAKVSYLRDWLRDFRPDVAHGFMKRASSLLVLASCGCRCKVVGSDYSTAAYGRHKPVFWASTIMFGLTKAIVCETEMNRRALARVAPWLRGRLRVVRNGVDTDRFHPLEREPQVDGFRFVCVGTVYGVKNPVRIVEAAALLAQRSSQPFTLEWYGRPGLTDAGKESPEYERAVQLTRSLGLQDRVRFLGPRSDIERVYPEADALLHVAVQEGMPNAVIEAMACGLPIVVGRVADLPSIVKTARNGFVCDQTRPEAIADAMEAMMNLAPAEHCAMGLRSRELAERWFGKERFIDEFEAIYRSVTSKA